MKKFEQYSDQIARLYPPEKPMTDDGQKVLSQSVTFQVTDDCNLSCFIAGTKILMDDFSYKNIEDVKTGDRVLAFNENTPRGKQMKIFPTTVTHTFMRHGNVRKIQAKDGDEIICTDEHPFLDGRRQWVRAENINTSKKLMKFLGFGSYVKADINNLNYMKGYVISAFLGDGHMFFYKHCNPVSNPINSQSRLAVKDVEILERVKTYLPFLDIEFTTYPFKISIIDNIYVDAIYLNKQNSLKLKELIESNWNINNTYDYYCGFLAGIIDTEGNIEKKCGYIRIFNTHDEIIKQCQTALKSLGFEYSMEKERQGVNLILKSLRVLNPRNTTTVLRLQLIIQCAVNRKGYQTYYGNAAFKRENVASITDVYGYKTVYNLETESHTYIANNFLVHNCNYCVTGDTKIRMADNSLKPIKDVQLGDEVLGFEEFPQKGKQTKVVKSTVEKLYRREASTIKLTFESEETLNITPNHKILVKRNSYDNKYDYIEAGKLKIGDDVYYLPIVDSNVLSQKLKIVNIEESQEIVPVYNLGTSSRTYIANTIAVHNCYQTCRKKRTMSFETAKKFADLIISGDKGFSKYINPEKSPGLAIDFIGGEPFLEIELIDKICDYIVNRLIELNHPWAMKLMFSICSNGTLYRDEKVQAFLRKWANRLSFSVTIDGDKQLHDSCRVFPDGSPSYDLAVDAAQDWMKRGYYMGSKITIAPGNISFLFDAIKHMTKLGYEEINANCVYEEGWTAMHATTLYDQMKRISDYFLEQNYDFERDFYCSLYNEDFFKPKNPEDLQSWCFKAGTRILTPNGNVNIEDLKIGDKVITASGNIKSITNTMTHLSDDTRIVKIAGIEPLYTTADHPILAKRLLNHKKNGKNTYSEPMWIKASELKKSDKVGVYKHKLGKIHVNPYLAYVVGRYVGDGWCSKGNYKLCSSYDEVNELKKWLDKANIKYSTYDYRTVKQFNIYKSNTELLSIISDAGHLAHGKRIPKVVFLWNKISVGFLLRGLFDADGYLDKKRNRQKFNTTSSFLIQDVMTLLRGLGRFPMESIYHRAGVQAIEGRIVRVRDRYKLDYFLHNRSSRSIYDSENGIIWNTVYSSEKTEPYEVYNLTVEGEHTYIANGIIVHNCGGTGNSMISCDPDGRIFPCIRYMESSLGGQQEPYAIGDVDNGIGYTECYKCRMDCMAKIDRRTQTTDECFYCPIAAGCSNCSAYDYQINGTPDSKATYICIMHKARALGNVYFWNNYYRKNNINKRMKLYVPDDWALEIISEYELNMLKELANEN